MSAMLQIIAVMKTLGAITPKDHSIAPANQGTMEMDTIVQVKSSACVWLTYPLVSFKKKSGNLFFFGRTRKHRDIAGGGGGHVRRLNVSII